MKLYKGSTGNRIIVPQNYFGKADFSKVEELATSSNLEKGVLGITYHSRHGTFAHATDLDKDKLDDYLLFMKRAIDLESKAYVVGGMDVVSEPLVQAVAEVLRTAGFEVVGHDVFGQLRRIPTLDKNGVLTIKYVQQLMTRKEIPVGEPKIVNLGR